MDWIEITLTTTHEKCDDVCAALYDIGISGVSIEDFCDIDDWNKNVKWDMYWDEELLARRTDDVLIKCYVSADSDVGATIRDITAATSITPHVANVKESDWAENWKTYYHTLHIGNRVVIKPTWEDYVPQPHEVVVEMDPGMAFGTGTHETTKMCIELLESRVLPTSTVLDMGTGSGILAISALKLGASRATAVDIDPNAVKVAVKNAEDNQVSDRATILCGDLVEKVSGKYKIVVANIIADVIIDLCPKVLPFFDDGCVVITSGIIKDRAQDVETAFLRSGLKVLEKKELGEWVAYISTRV